MISRGYVSSTTATHDEHGNKLIAFKQKHSQGWILNSILSFTCNDTLQKSHFTLPGLNFFIYNWGI